MKKKLSALLLCMVLSVSLLPVNALATSAKQSGSAGVSAQVYSTIKSACSVPGFVPTGKADSKNLAKAEKIVAQANRKIDLWVAHAQHTAKNDVPQLLVKIDRLVEQTRRQVNQLGFDLQCEYVAYEIDGQTVLIDPLRVINPR